MTYDQEVALVEMWVGCYDAADIAASTGLTLAEVSAEIDRLERRD